MKILVSACLRGENCKYNGGNNACQSLIDFVRNHELISVYPEMMGGLPAPRLSAEIVNGSGNEQEALNIAQKKGAELAVLQPRSPAAPAAAAVRFMMDHFQGN